MTYLFIINGAHSVVKSGSQTRSTSVSVFDQTLFWADVINLKGWINTSFSKINAFLLD